jgi:hypothetical protein
MILHFAQEIVGCDMGFTLKEYVDILKNRRKGDEK